MASTISTLIAAVKLGAGATSTADTSLTAPSTTVVVATAGANGARVARIYAKCAATSAAALVRVFLKRAGTFYLLEELTIAAATSSNTVAAASAEIRYPDGLPLETGDTIECTTTIAQATRFFCEYGNL